MYPPWKRLFALSCSRSSACREGGAPGAGVARGAAAPSRCSTVAALSDGRGAPTKLDAGRNLTFDGGGDLLRCALLTTPCRFFLRKQLQPMPAAPAASRIIECGFSFIAANSTCSRCFSLLPPTKKPEEPQSRLFFERHKYGPPNIKRTLLEVFDKPWRPEKNSECGVRRSLRARVRAGVNRSRNRACRPTAA